MLCCGSQWLTDRAGSENGTVFVPLEGSYLNREGENQSKHRRHFSFNHSYTEIYFAITGERRISRETAVSTMPDDLFFFFTFCVTDVDEEYLTAYVNESLIDLMIVDLWRTVKC